MPRDVQAAVPLIGAAMATAAVVSPSLASDFATAVIEYRPAPGQFINNSQFNDPARALGAPIGGGTQAADNTKIVSLGGFGGAITLRFVPAVLDDPRNAMGLDAIVFGNAVWIGGDPAVRFGEAGVIEISRDANGNGLADDPWFAIPGSHLPAAPASSLRTQPWDASAGTSTPPANTSWYPSQSWFPGWPGAYSTSAYELPAEFRTDRLDNGAATEERRRGYADCSPTLLLGDRSGADGGPGDNSLDDPEDDPAIEPGEFYTAPDDPFTIGVSPGSGGGEAFDIAWAVDGATGLPAGIERFDFIRISTAVDALIGPGGVLGEASTEIGGVADVRPTILTGDINADGLVNSSDLAQALGAWGVCTAPCAADANGDGVVNSEDVAMILGAWGSHV